VSSESATTPAHDVWGDRARTHQEQPPLGWLDTKWVLEGRVYPLVFGEDLGGWWTPGAMTALGVPIGGEWLDLGCGSGGNEVNMATNDLFDHMVAYDPSPGSIELAAESAREAGISSIDFRQADVNSLELPEERYDVVHINMALHHVVELEHVLHEVNRTLRPGGVFIANEYVGPNQFQFSAERMALVRHCLEAMPERLRWNPIAKETKEAQPRYSRSWWDGYDPTEAVRSDEIPPVIATNFPAFKRLDYGGNLLNLVLENIAQNFNPEDAEDATHITLLYEIEDAMLGEEPSDFAYFVCPRGSKADRARGRALRDAQYGRFARPTQVVDIPLADIGRAAEIALESDSGSARPVVGPAITRTKQLVRRALRFHLEPTVRQQTTFNDATVAALGRLVDELNRELLAVREENELLRNELRQRG
jgi:SAM-dependent methyltransferase